MRDLERELRALTVAWPETPDLVAAVRPRLEPRRTRRRIWPALLAAAALLLGGVAAVEPARSAVLEFLGLKSVRIERREPTATPTPPGASLGLGRPVARARYSPPATLGEPDAIFDDGRIVTFVYGDPPETLVMLAEATVGPFIEKSVGASAKLERFRLDGDPAFFISGGRHGVAFAERGGGDVRFDEQRLAGNTLLVERSDGTLIRIEGDLTRERATAIARSIPR